MSKNNKNIIVVGGGMAGLIAATYSARSGHKVTLFEKGSRLGGLVNSFERNGFIYDGGIRSIENSGMIFPMLKHLGIEMDWVKSNVSLGLEDDIIKLTDESSLSDYENFLKRHFPESLDDIDGIMDVIKKIMTYMDVLYGIDNPVFADKMDPKYAMKVILPWFVKYLRTIGKIMKMDEPVDEYIAKLTDNKQLSDNIVQHFFKNTPASFALSYFSLYLDYHYPLGGTGKLPEKIAEKAREFGVDIKLSTAIDEVDPDNKMVIDSRGYTHEYDELIWAADLKTLYYNIKISKLSKPRTARIVRNKCKQLTPLKGGDSVFTLYLSTDLGKEYFKNICSEHFFYTPVKTGLSTVDTTAIDAIVNNSRISNPGRAREIIETYLKDFFSLNTYEISIPVLRDSTLAPDGKTGLVISTLFDYHLAKKIKLLGWYDEFKTFAEQSMIDALNKSVFPDLKQNIIDRFSSSPLSIEEWVSSTHGAITGWAFTNPDIPVVHTIKKMFSAVDTPLPHVYQAGQWSYSPSGIPISVFTGKRAADKAVK